MCKMSLSLNTYWITIVGICLKCFAITDGSLIPIFQSNACYLTGECGLHWLDCPENHRIAISSASHGFKPYSDACFHEGPGVDCFSLNTTYCCSEQADQDCVLSYREQHLQSIFEKCSGNPTCKTPPISVTDACYSMSRSEPASFSKVQYGCIQESTIVNFCQKEMVVGPSVSAMFKPNGLNMLYDKNCYCRIESATSQVIDVQVYALDIRFRRSTSDTCSELSISKGRETHGTVSTPTHPGDGFIHSFLPLINLTTPILTRLMLSKYALPDYIWLHFESISGDLRVKCGRDSNRRPPSCMHAIQPTVPSPNDFTPDPISRPKKFPPVVSVMIGVMRILFYEKTPVIGGGIAAVVTVFASFAIGIILYKRRHLKKIMSIQPLSKGYNSSNQQATRSNRSRVVSPRLGLGRARNGSQELNSDVSSEGSAAFPAKEPSQGEMASTIAQRLVSDVQSLQPNIPNDANIIIVSRSNPSRHASIRSSCTCSSRGQATSSTVRPPDVVLDSRAVLQPACNGAVTPNNCCNHNVFKNVTYWQGDLCNHGNNLCSHGHQGLCCGQEVQLRPDRLNSVTSHVSIGTQIYGDPLPEIPEVPVLPTSKRKSGIVLSHCLDENNPMYIVHNTKTIKESVPNSHRIFNWLKKCKLATRKPPESAKDERKEKSLKKQESNIEEVIINMSGSSPSVLPLPAPPTAKDRELPELPSRPSSVPSIAPPKPPPRLPPRPPRRSIRNALKTMNDVYTQVVNLPPKRQKVKPRVPRRRTQDMSTQVYQEVPIAASTEVKSSTAVIETKTPTVTEVKTPAVIEVTAQTESDSSNYANDYIVPVHGSRGYSLRRGENTVRYDEVSLDNDTGDINFLHTVTLGLPPEDEEDETVSRFDRLKSVLLQSLMRFRRK